MTAGPSGLVIKRGNRNGATFTPEWGGVGSEGALRPARPGWIVPACPGPSKRHCTAVAPTTGPHVDIAAPLVRGRGKRSVAIRFSRMPATVRPVRDLLADDLAHLVLPTRGRSLRWRLDVAGKILLLPRVRAVVHHRFAQLASQRGLLPAAYLIQRRAIRTSGAEISPQADIGPGLALMHSVGIVVGPQVVVGRNLQIYQGVTLGDGPSPGQPTVGDDVVIGAGAKVLGGITVGDRVVVGANTVVTQDVPADSVVSGSPAVVRPRSDRHSHYSRPSTG